MAECSVCGGTLETCRDCPDNKEHQHCLQCGHCDGMTWENVMGKRKKDETVWRLNCKSGDTNES